MYISQNKKVANLSAKKHVIFSCCGSPIKVIFLVAATEKCLNAALCAHQHLGPGTTKDQDCTEDMEFIVSCPLSSLSW